MEKRLRIVIKQGDITEEEVDAIVNAANTGLRVGGGVDGAIHRAGGPTILEECRKIGGCPTGEARITSGGNLPAKWVIHTVGPVWQGGNKKEEQLLCSAYTNSLKLAAEKGLKTIAFPSISTGVYRFPIDRASGIALQAVRDISREESSLEEVRFILFSEHDLQVYEAQYDKE